MHYRKCAKDLLLFCCLFFSPSKAWIGLHKVNNEWRWSDGTSVNFTDWSTLEPQPDNVIGQECVQIGISACPNACYVDTLSWNDRSCITENRFICKK